MIFDMTKRKSGGGGGGTLITKTITDNGVYNAADDSADGYSSVTVSVGTYLPSAYQACEYVQNASNAYIILNHPTWDLNVSAEIEASFTSYGSKAGILIGATSYGGCWFGILSNGKMGLGTGSGQYFADTDYQAKRTFELYKDSTGIYCKKGQTIINRAFSNGNQNVEITLFDASTFANPCLAKIYAVRIYSDGHLANNLVPCYRKSDSVAGLYSTTSQTFITPNRASLTAGPDVIYDTAALGILLGGA